MVWRPLAPIDQPNCLFRHLQPRLLVSLFLSPYTRPMARIRLYVDQALDQGQSVALSREHAHYLFGVMRRKAGDKVYLFNGSSGEWSAEISEIGKRQCQVTIEERSAPQLNPPDIWLLFAPIKKARTDFIVEKATELGAAKIFPVHTQFTNSERIRKDRLQAHAIEAAEQCGGTFVPEISELSPLSSLLKDWDPQRKLIFCDEEMASQPGLTTFPPAPAALLIGPEGGFSDVERKMLNSLPFTVRIGLGPRVLRADTAAVAALTLWQATSGDWRNSALIEPQ